MPTTRPQPCPPDPAATWKALAHLIAARPNIRVWDPTTNKFDRTSDLTSRLPRVPAAALLYQHNRTHILVLDFDTKRHGQHAVDADFARALSWITDAGGVAVTDQSTSGGRHIIVPLAIGTTATLAEIMPLMRLLEARLPSLDKTPMTNPKTGCITVPGSPCREGGHRILDGPLAAAIDAFTTRSDPGLLPRLNVLLGALHPAPHRQPTRHSRSRRHHRHRAARTATPRIHPHHRTSRAHHRLRHHRPTPRRQHLAQPLRSAPSPSWHTPPCTATAWPPSKPSSPQAGPGTPASPPPTPATATTPTTPCNATGTKP